MIEILRINTENDIGGLDTKNWSAWLLNCSTVLSHAF